MKNTIEEAAELIRRAAFMAVGTVRQVWQTAPSKTYTTMLNEQVSKSSIKAEKWLDDYTLGFFVGLTARHSYAHPRIFGLLDSMKKENSDEGL